MPRNSITWLYLKLASGETAALWAYPAEDAERACIKLTPIPLEAVVETWPPCEGGSVGYDQRVRPDYKINYFTYMASSFFTVFLSEALESTQYMDYGFEQAQNSLGSRGGDLHLPLARSGRRLQGMCLERRPSK